MARANRRSILWGGMMGLALGLLGACASPPPSTPGPPLAPTLSPSPTTDWQRPENEPTAEPAPQATEIVDITLDNGAVNSLEPAVTAPAPAYSGLGLRPAEAVLHRAADPDLEPAVEWRPPPVPVPHSLHPDDHYWLARPLPSDSRNYDLEWYAFGNRPMRTDALPYRVHHGLDFPNDTGTPIFAASSGEVIWAGPLPSNRDGVNYYGNTVVIKHDWQWQDQDVYTLYAHTLELFVEVGDQVEQGQLIAGVGASGEVSGPHLHLEVRVGENNYSAVRNPILWLAPYEGWGVLAGRFMDDKGRLIHGAQVTVMPIALDGNVEVPVRRQRTYEPSGVQSDDIWGENFVVGDLPAGLYRVVLTTAGETFRREVRIKPGMTNFVIFQADFTWAPTYTPTPTPTSTPTPLPTLAVTPTPS